MVGKTNDMYFAAALLSYGAEIQEVDKTDPKRQVFIFKNIPKSVWAISDDGGVCRLDVRGTDDIRTLMLAEKLFFPPNFVHSIKQIRSFFYVE